jgi:hypothetical protein
MRLRVLIAAVSTVTALSVGGASASTWTGTTSQDWNDGTNWNANPPTGDFIVNNTASPGLFPIIAANSAFTPVDLRVGTVPGVIGRIDHVAGLNGTGNGNWFFLGYLGANAIYNLANTAGTGGTYTGFATGSGSLNVGGTAQNGNLLAGLDNGTVSTVNVNTTGTLAAGGIFLGAAGASNGNMNVDAGTVNVTGELQVGANFFGQGAGTNNNYRQSGGNVTTGIFSMSRGANNATAMNSTATITGGTLNTRRFLTLGFAGGASNTSTFNLSGGTVNVNTSLTDGQMEMAVFDLTKNAFNVVSGSLNLMGNSSIIFGAGGNHSGVSTITQSGGSVTFYADNGITAGGTGSINLGFGNSTGTETYNLNGGTLIVPQVRKTGANANGTFNFNGGVIKPTGSTATFMQGLTAANVQAGGALIDTNGFTITIAQNLLDGGGGGGLVKSGTGGLYLNGTNTYTGVTSLQAGTLGGSGSLAGSLVSSTGTRVAPGNSIGTFTVGSATLGGSLQVEYDGTGAGSIDLLNVLGNLNISAATADFSQLGAPADDPAYIFATYGSLTGTFASLLNVPAGYAVNYAYAGNNIALVAIPEPTTLAMILAGGVIAIRRRRA